MTAPAARRTAAAPRPGAATLVTGAVAVAGTALLAARPALVAASPTPVALLVVLFVAILVAGTALPLPAARVPALRAGRRSTTLVVLIGVVAFAVGRAVVGGHPPTTATLFLVATNTLAAVAEEAWFRRLWFGLLAPAGDGLAIAGSTVLFAVVHVSIYGAWVLPLDLAAGLLFAWQRSATGSWGAPAVTHAVANLLVAL